MTDWAGTGTAAAASSTNQLTFGDLIERVGLRLKGSTAPTGDDLAEVKDIINDGYLMFLSESDWTFLSPDASLVLFQSVDTDSGITVTCVGTTCTASAAVFYPAMVGRSIVITDTGTYTISAYTSTTVVTLASAATCTTKTFSITADGFNALPTDFGELISPPTHAPDEVVRTMQDRPYEWIRHAKAETSDTTGIPTSYVVVPRVYSASLGDRWDLFVDPTPDDDYTVYYRYRRHPALLVATSDIPLGNPGDGLAILHAAFKIAEERRGDVSGVFHRLYYGDHKIEGYLPISLRRDYARRTRNLGYNSDNETRVVKRNRSVGDLTAT